jgi:NnrS protein
LLVAAAAAREILAGRNWRNLNVVMLVLLLLAGNIAFHLEAHFDGAADTGIRIGIAVVVVLIPLIGGRIIPSFTRNWLVRENPGRLPTPFGRFDVIVVAIGALALAVWVVSPAGRLTGAGLAIAGLLHLVRLGRWAGDRTWRERLVLILHVGYAFVPLGFLLNAASAFELVPVGAGIHAWMVGAAGTMTLAVMSRATLGHTGQPAHRICHHAGDLCRDHHRRPGAYLRGDRSCSQRAVAASCCVGVGSRLFRIRHLVWAAVGRHRSARAGGAGHGLNAQESGNSTDHREIPGGSPRPGRCKQFKQIERIIRSTIATLLPSLAPGLGSVVGCAQFWTIALEGLNGAFPLERS